ncbi:hypothetical protein MG5_05428 [Candida albicans P57072]|nr:hypothetical protein MG1_05472 [Candida albicans GC75]KGR01573.1 hypothetical protein MG5_05428 [Candida albicans P57072]KGR07632.1 hypothetical protein MG9_05459 [Candida albicans P37037]KGU01935.1 hypothetical protein MEQ_05402 [Candida albicans P87]KGU03175.1 hypothetical protein MEM_05458 [Candida albicans L26]KGU03444.1 hypothetical protein MEY_05412 [Candida albicans 19F]KGU19973.1 hypothetical protein MG7_05452 [Candida albicans P34048]KGU22343.1 hypothetical protein MGK_05454 [Can
MSQLQQYNDLTEESMSSSHEEYDDEYSDYTSDEDSEYALSAQEHWEESMKQLTMLFSIVIFPLIGKLLGRRFSKIIWRKVANWWFV